MANLHSCRKRSRRPRNLGATLTLIFGCVFVLLLLGIGLFMLAKIIGGFREVAHGSDAAILSVAREAVVRPTVNVSTLGLNEFQGLGRNNSDDLSLLSYNRAVALTLLVMMNAQDEGTTTASTNAGLLVNKLRTLSQSLSNQFDNSNDLQTAYDNLAGARMAKFFGGSYVERQGNILNGYARPGGSTNVFFNPNSLIPSVPMSNYLNTAADYTKSNDGHAYIKGYEALTMAGQTVVGTPVFPKTKPHLISHDEFTTSNTLSIPGWPVTDLPPNSFEGTGRASDNNSNQFGAATGSSIVGVIDQEYVGLIPNGYIKIKNGQGLELPPVSSGVSDGDNDIFNKELFSPSMIVQAPSKVFTTDVAQMNAWINYNNSGDDPNLYPPSLGYIVSNMRYGAVQNGVAPLSLLEEITSTEVSCTHLMYTGGLTGPCVDDIEVWKTNYDRRHATLILPTHGYIAVEYTKARVLQERCKNAPGDNMPPPQNTAIEASFSGLKRFDRTFEYTVAPSGGDGVQFATLGTPWQLMEQCGATLGHPSMITLLQRVREFRPSTTMTEIQNILNTRQLPLDDELYLYANNNGDLVLDDVGPALKYNGPADGPPNPPLEQSYGPLGYSINTRNDCGYGDRPYSIDQDMVAYDRMKWTKASGYRNLLMEIEFENEVRINLPPGQVTGQFRAPN